MNNIKIYTHYNQAIEHVSKTLGYPLMKTTDLDDHLKVGISFTSENTSKPNSFILFSEINNHTYVSTLTYDQIDIDEITDGIVFTLLKIPIFSKSLKRSVCRFWIDWMFYICKEQFLRVESAYNRQNGRIVRVELDFEFALLSDPDFKETILSKI